MLLFFLITLINTNVKTETIDCMYNHLNELNCGPCDSSQQCEINCIGYESCKASKGDDRKLACKGNKNCEIICNGEIDGKHDTNMGKSCLDAAIYTENVTNTTINCISYEDCKNTKIYTSNINSLIINCMDSNYNTSKYNCQDMYIDASLSMSVEINCNAYHSCKKMHLTCGNDCMINCNANQGNVCDGLNVTCGTGNCQINCNGYNKCPGIVINTEKATSFTCIGSANDCMYAPIPFVRNITTLYPTPNVQTSDLYINPTVYTATTNTTPITQSIIPTFDRNVKKLETTKIINEQNDNIQSETFYDFSEVPQMYLVVAVIIGLTCTICLIAICVILFQIKWLRKNMNYQQRVKSIETDINRNKNGDSKPMVHLRNTLYNAECDEGMIWNVNNNGIDDQSELDSINNVIINPDDEVIQEINNMTITGGVNFDLDMNINDCKSGVKVNSNEGMK